MAARCVTFWLYIAATCTISFVQGEPCYLNTTTCVPVTMTTCFSTKVSFSHTTLLYVNESISTQQEVQDHLSIWANLRRVPECWAVIQPFLCSVYMPRCNAGDQTVERPNRELCERVRDPCQSVLRYNGSWPSFLQCDQWFVAESCGQTQFETSMFNTDGECVVPLIATTEETNWYKSIHGCGVQCENPLYTSEEHTVVHVFTAVLGGLCIICTVFTLLTFVIDWKTGRKYPAVILFFINGCFLISTLGWMAQFINRDDIVCRKDGTIRKGEPLIGSGETASCTVVFILVYYFTLAGVVWFVMLAYSWDIHFKALGTVRDDLSKKTSYFHIGSWCVPLVLTIICLSVSEIDADSLSGICFPGFFDSVVRSGFVLVPIALVLLLSTIFCVRGLLTLIRVKKDSPSVVSDKATAKIGETIIRLSIFLALVVALAVITFCIHAYTFSMDNQWQTSFEEYTFCKSNISVMQLLDDVPTSPCELDSRPSIVAAMVHVFTFFGAGILMSSWSWTRASLQAWERLFRRIFNKPSNKPQKLRKHRVIAKAFKRQKKRNNERLSVSYGTDHDDPMGMKFDLNSNSSHSQSSGFALAIPRSRRHRGVINPGFRRSRRYSDSDLGSHGSKIPSSKRASSRSSRRESYESSMSQKLSDIEREIRHEERRKRRRKRRKKRPNRVQPILEPISSNMMALQQRRMLGGRRRHHSDSSDLSRNSAHKMNLATGQNKHSVNNHSFLGSSNLLSESVTTNSVSEVDLPHFQPKIPDFSMFTANSMLPPTDREERENTGVQQTTNLKGTKSSPSGSFRRGRRREVKLEMTETSFYQEDDDNIEIAGNQTIHCEDNRRESGEIRGQHLKELGPLVTEMFEQARANSSNGRNSGQRDPMGSSRLGSASSRGSKGSRKSLPKDNLKYATAKVNLPDRPHGVKGQKRPFSGDYVLVNRKENAKRDHETRKSQSNPGSRVSSATHHKRQIGQNGRIDFTEGLNWSRFLQDKGHVPGQLFAFPPTFKGTVPVYSFHAAQPGQLQILDKHQLENPTIMQQPSRVDVLNIEEEQKMLAYSPSDSPVKPLSPFVNVLNVEEEQKKCHPHLDGVDILNIEEEHRKHLKRKRGEEKVHSQNSPRNKTVNVLNIDEEQRQRRHRRGSVSSGSRTSEYVNSGSASSRSSRNVQYDGIQSGTGTGNTKLKQEVDEEFYRRIDESSLLPGLEARGKLQDYVDYEIDSEYDDMTDDLTDTYTYTSNDDDLTEVSSLPC